MLKISFARKTKSGDDIEMENQWLLEL